MFCSRHKERIALAKCERCGCGVCAECLVVVNSENYCRNCATDNVLAVSVVHMRNPLLAFLFSLVFPGMGQVYNGQVTKGMFIFISSWLIVPWIYGIVDAVITARRVNAGIVKTRPSTGSLVGCALLILLFWTSPLLLFAGLRHISVFKEITVNETTAINTLFKISRAAEAYREEKGTYPSNYADLYFTEPPFIDDLYCDVSLSGWNYSCVFSPSGYRVNAVSEPGLFGMERTFTVVTGGELVTVPSIVPKDDKFLRF